MRLFRIEWSKLVKYRPFIWLTLSYLVMTPGLMLFLDGFNLDFFGITLERIYVFPQGWNSVTWMASWFHILLGIIIVIFISNEYSNRMVRQHIIDGLTRKEFYVSKVLMIAVMSITATLYTAILAIIGSVVYSGGVDNFMDGIEYLPIFLFQTFGYLSIAMVFAFLLRKSGYAILIYLGVIFGEFILRSILGANVSPWLQVFSPIGMISNLTPLPFFQEILNNQEDTKYFLSVSERFLYGSIYISAILYWAWWLIRKRDI